MGKWKLKLNHILGALVVIGVIGLTYAFVVMYAFFDMIYQWGTLKGN